VEPKLSKSQSEARAKYNKYSLIKNIIFIKLLKLCIRRGAEKGYSRSLGPTVAPIIAPLAALEPGFSTLATLLD
jgi:hypothetical protein